MTNLKRKEILKKVLRIAIFLFTDICALVFSQFLTLHLRTELSFSALSNSIYLDSVLYFCPLFIAIGLTVFALLGLYNSLWAYAGMDEAIRVALASIVTCTLQYVLMHLIGFSLPRSFPFICALVLCLLALLTRFSYRLVRSFRHQFQQKSAPRTLLFGAGSAGVLIVRDSQTNEKSRNKIVCIIDDDAGKSGRTLCGVPIVGGRDMLNRAIRKYRVQEILFAVPSSCHGEKRKLLTMCQDTGLPTKTVPSIAELTDGRVTVSDIRPVQIEDLLGRDSVAVNPDEIAGYVSGKTVLVTGGGGSIGSELCRQIATHAPQRLIVFDIYENNAYAIQQELLRNNPNLPLTVLIGSVRDEERINELFRTYLPQIVFHAAAHKHVPLMEDSPCEAVKNNVFGTQNVARAADRFGAETFVLISSDKAVNPTNVMGATKRICEMLVQDFSRRSATKFVAVRFGNVLGSNGSVIPLFKKQIRAGGPVTVTHRDIIRYFMTIPEAVSLVLQTGAYASGGEIFILDMGEPVRIDDLARNMIRLSGLEPDVDIRIEYTGLRPGEKLFEELLMQEEGMRSTANSLIFVGRPIDIDHDRLEHELAVLQEHCNRNDPAVRTIIEQVVPTYQNPEKQAACS